MDFASMLDGPQMEMLDMAAALDAIQGMLSKDCAHGNQAFIPLEFPDEAIGEASGISAKHAKFLKKQRKAFQISKKNRKYFICDICAKKFWKKEKIVSHMLKAHLPQQKPVASAGNIPWYRSILTEDSLQIRSNQVWRIRQQQDGKRGFFVRFIPAT